MNEESARPSLLARLSEVGRSFTERLPISKQSVDVRALFTAAVVGGVTLFVVWNVSPWLWFTDTTPTGGDLGAHVWAPAYLRDELLPNFRLTGWSPDWYAGFPAFTFYMVVPSLLIVIVNVGLDISIDLLSAIGVALGAFLVSGRFWAERTSKAIVAFGLGVGSALFGAVADGRVFATDWLGWSPLEPFTFNDTSADLAIVALLLPAAVGTVVWSRMASVERWRALITAGAVLATVLVVPIPYGVAMKLVVIAGIVALPVSAYFAGRLSGLAFPGPALLALMTLPFIFDRSFNIYGGNLMSTMAGEFAYSLALSVSLLFIGYAARGLSTGRDRAAAAVLLALTGLLHLFAAFFALVALFAMLLVRLGRREIAWVAVVGPLAALLSAFWVLPFAWNVRYLNDMGWGKERRYAAALWHRGDNLGNQDFLVNDLPLQVFVVLALAGAVVCAVRRIRFGLVLSVVAAIFALAFVLLPESRLWNVRILPFYYLSIYLLAGIAVAEFSRLGVRMFRAGRADYLLPPAAVASAESRQVEESEEVGQVGGSDPAVWAAVPVGLFTVLILIVLAFPLRSVPFATNFQRVDAGGEVSNLYGFSNVFGIGSVGGWDGFATDQFNHGPGWVRYNFTGYEQKSGTVEYRELVSTMAGVGEEFGCGRSLWEFESERLGTYGTTMAPMLLPHWTDGCIGSMEGLYFEASATTPYHFLLQSELSASPSRAQRDLPYSGLNVDKGVAGLQTLGVRYYLAVSESAIAQAREIEAFTEIASSGPWVVFLVKGQQTAVGLEQLPVVIEGLDAGGEEWLVPTVAAWETAEDIPLIAADGPDGWPRMSLDDLASENVVFASAAESGDRVSEMRALATALDDWLVREPVEPAQVVDLAVDNDSIRFIVDRIGTPVLVRASYFPNWTVAGADGPFRVAPNLMVVVPTESSVELSYTRSPVQWVGWLATLLGIALLVVVIRRRWEGSGGGSVPFWDFGGSRTAGSAAPSANDDAVDQMAQAAATLEADATTDVRLSVVVPAYCEAQRIASTISEIRAQLSSLEEAGDLEIVVVDDGSADETARVARGSGADLVIELPMNRGKGAAVRAGVLASRGRTVAFTDADLAYSPDQLLPMLATVEAGCDVVVGNRYAEDSVAHGGVSGMRRLGSRMVNLFARALLSVRYRDTQCGCKVFRSDAARTLMGSGQIDGFAFDIEVLFLAERYGFSIVESPVTVVNSGSSTVRAWSDGFKVASDIALIRRLGRRGAYSSVRGQCL